MLKDNLVMLRNIHGYSQEEIAEKINISRQAYAKWETGATVPDIEKCSLLADIYGVSIDSLVKSESTDSFSAPLFSAKGKNIWGSVTVNSRGQIVIPKEARKQFNLKSGSRLLVLSNEDGIALTPAEKFEDNIREFMELAAMLGKKDKTDHHNL